MRKLRIYQYLLVLSSVVLVWIHIQLARAAFGESPLGQARTGAEGANASPPSNLAAHQVRLDSKQSIVMNQSAAAGNISLMPLAKSNQVLPPDNFDPNIYAYASMISGCAPSESSYKGFLYSVLVSRKILLEEGTNVPMVLFVQMSSTSSATTLPDEEARVLAALNIQIQYIPPAKTFTDAVMSKFRILSLTQYRRVLYLDADVMPIGNLDYFFYLSDNTNDNGTHFLQENVVITGVAEPAHGGFFMLTPGEGDWTQLDIMLQNQKNSVFDETEGWGHVITPPDSWETREWPKGPRKRGYKWSFNGANVDQGLLYYWVKYYKKKVTFVRYDDLMNFGEGVDGNVTWLRRIRNPFSSYSNPRFRYTVSCNRFICDFVHFTNRQKPWINSKPLSLQEDLLDQTNPEQLWWLTLMKLNKELDMGIDFSKWQVGQRPPLGYFATNTK